MSRILAAILSRIHLSPFGHLNCTQFLGAMNDNIFKLLIVYCCIHLNGTSSTSAILALCGAVYVTPFLLFSSTAGPLADRYSKKTIIVITKIAETLVMLLGILAFSISSMFLAFTALFLLATHSAAFAPCKYGIIPELVAREDIPKANGIITSCTYIAIIVGTFLASFLTEISHRNFVFVASISLLFAIIGLITSSKIFKTPPAAAQKKISASIIRELKKALRIIRREPSLSSAVFGSAYFLFVGSFIQLNMIPYAMNALHLSDVQGGYLFLLTALGIGVGSFVAGRLSGKSAELGLVPIGGFGMTLCCFLLDHWSDDISYVIPIVIMLGAFAGVYLVPLDSFIQIASPNAYRGQVIGAVNFFGFFGVLVSAGMLYFLSEILGLEADEGFSIIGTLTLGVIIAISVSISGYIVRFASFMISFFFYPVTLRGKEEIPLQLPSLFFTALPYWPWACALLASQRRRMRLFIIADSQAIQPLFARLAKRLIPILEVPTVEELLPAGEYGELIRHSLERGASIAVFYPETLLGAHGRLSSVWRQELPRLETPHFVLCPIESDLTSQKRTAHSSLLAEAVKL